MHIVDGALSNPVVIGGALLAAGGIARGLKELSLERIPAAGMLSASFFVAPARMLTTGMSLRKLSTSRASVERRTQSRLCTGTLYVAVSST